MSDLTAAKCEACNKQTPAVSGEELVRLRSKLDPDWLVIDEVQLRRKFKFPNFSEAFALTSKVAELAEAEGHHPDLQLGWGYLVVDLTTHAIKALSQNDFIMAAKIDALAA